jgi:hypothetical protein
MEDKAKYETFTLLAQAPHIIATGERLTRPTPLDFRAIAAEVPQETKLALCAWFMEKCVEHAREGGSFRTLIFKRLGFGVEAWVPLYLAGGMSIAHHFHFQESSEADEAVRTTLARIAGGLANPDERSELIEAMFRFEELAEVAAAWTVVIKNQRQELNGQSQYVGDLIQSLRAAADLVKLLGNKLVEIGGNAELGELIDRQLRLFEQTIDRVQPRE